MLTSKEQSGARRFIHNVAHLPIKIAEELERTPMLLRLALVWAFLCMAGAGAFASQGDALGSGFVGALGFYPGVGTLLYNRHQRKNRSTVTKS